MKGVSSVIMLLLIGLLAYFLLNPASVFAPKVKEVTLTDNKARVVILEYDSRKRDTYTYDLRLTNLPENNDGYCYLETDPILWRGQRYATYTWRIEGLKLKAPIKGNMCYFNDWQMVNPTQAKYVYTECSSVGCLTTTMDCEKRDCLNFAIPEAKKISGVLYIKEVAAQPTQQIIEGVQSQPINQPIEKVETVGEALSNDMKEISTGLGDAIIGFINNILAKIKIIFNMFRWFG